MSSRPEKECEPKQWDKALAACSLGEMMDMEQDLLYRLAAARGRRVPLSELSESFGLPAAPSIDEDFPALSSFCKSLSTKDGGPVCNPVVAGGTDEPWYWMSVTDANAFRLALDEAFVGTE